MKICSLLPSATEILFALGLGMDIVGVSHECDFPPEARSKPILIRSRISDTGSPSAIDAQVREFLARGESLYSVDIAMLEALDPDLIVTQDLCHVCAATPDDLGAALAHLARPPQIVTLNPHSLADVCADIRMVGEATGRVAEADAVVAAFEADVADVELGAMGRPRPRVVCLEWLDPPYVAGHWVPEMVERTGGVDAIGKAGAPSFRVEWEQVIAAKPEVIVVMPCGYGLEKAEAELREMKRPSGWKNIPAVRDDRVFVVDACGYFSRPGPRLAQGMEILSDAIHAGERKAGGTDLAGRFLSRVAGR